MLTKPAMAGDIKLESIPNSKSKQGTIHQVLKASHDELWNTLTDIKDYGEYMPKMRKVEIKEANEEHIIYHAQINMPWPISDVEYDCEVKPSKNKDRIDFEMVEGTGKGVKTFYGHWEFKALSENEVDATYVLVFDSGKHYPQWAENLGLKSTLGQVMKNVQQRINRQRKQSL